MDRRIKVTHDFLTKTECDSILNNYLQNQPIDLRFISDRLFDFLKIDLKGFECNISNLKINKLDKTTSNPNWIVDQESYISFLIQLNDEYVDGKFQFLLDGGDTYFQLHHGYGKLVTYFSNIKNRTTPILSGTKYFLTGCITIEKLVEFKKTII
jgi:hypothetical protein